MVQQPCEDWFHIKGLVAGSHHLAGIAYTQDSTMSAAGMATQCQTISFQELTVVALLLQNVHTCALACASSQETCCMCNAPPKLNGQCVLLLLFDEGMGPAACLWPHECNFCKRNFIGSFKCALHIYHQQFPFPGSCEWSVKDSVRVRMYIRKGFNSLSTSPFLPLSLPFLASGGGRGAGLSLKGGKEGGPRWEK